MQIWVKTLTGRKISMDFDEAQEIKEVKQALQEKEGVGVEQIRLIYSGRSLADEKTLKDYSIIAGETIHMVLQLRGGKF